MCFKNVFLALNDSFFALVQIRIFLFEAGMTGFLHSTNFVFFFFFSKLKSGGHTVI